MKNIRLASEGFKIGSKVVHHKTMKIQVRKSQRGSHGISGKRRARDDRLVRLT